MKLIFAVAIALFVTGCDEQLPVAKIEMPLGVHELCIKGVKYYKSGQGLAVAFGKDSQVIQCNQMVTR